LPRERASPLSGTFLPSSHPSNGIVPFSKKKPHRTHEAADYLPQHPLPDPARKGCTTPASAGSGLPSRNSAAGGHLPQREPLPAPTPSRESGLSLSSPRPLP